ncbi:MAG: DUF3857 domain-containing transglutaminase family protein [Cyclobacteriaceae bacterium]|nr:DUF3857 domain-containing transglutaminase family protein [Cyclobacteriaceae bacterium]
MKKITILLLMIPLAAWPQAKDYAVALIPAELKEHAHVVVREKEQVFEIKQQNIATYTVHEVYTILGEKGKRFATEVVGYSKLEEVKSFTGMVYDAEGKVIRKLKQLDIYDQSAISGFSLYEDNRLKAAELAQGTYPYTVEFNYQVEFKYLFFIPGFTLTDAPNVSVQRATYKLMAPEELKPRWKLINTDQQPKQGVAKENTLYWEWRFENIPAVEEEPFGPELYERVPRIMAGPSKFMYANYAGTMESWDSFGQWILELGKGREVLPESTRKQIEELTHGLTEEQKIQAVYEYMQSKTRYVSIQIGIGGFQPFEANVVDQTGYGDCKALSNYTVALLRAAGVKANYVLIRAGRNAPPLEPDFPSTQFNHAVVAVPRQRDTLWLECTSQTNPFGYMGTFTGDRTALMITDTGAKVVYTPKYPDDLNVQSRTADLFVDEKGNAKANARTTYRGLQYENDGLHFILNNQYDEQKKWIERTTKIPSFDLNKFNVTQTKALIPSATVTLDLTLRNYVSMTGKRMFLNPNLMNRSTLIPEKVEARKSPVRIQTGFVDVDTIHIHLPENLYPEFVPESTRIKSRFGEYETSYRLDQGRLTYYRRLKVVKGEYGPDSYAELTDFFKRISKADQSKLVFLNKT